jgi:hypothetical protein
MPEISQSHLESIVKAASDDSLKKILRVLLAEQSHRANLKHKKQNLSLNAAAPSVFDEAAVITNSQSLLAIPHSYTSFKGRYRFIKPLMMQDWSQTYCRDTEAGDYYVYAHVDPGAKRFVPGIESGGDFGGMPFYIGKGIGNRAYDLKRNQGHGKKITAVKSKGWIKAQIVYIAFSGLSEQRAYELESKLIYALGSIYEDSKPYGILYNLDIPKTPEFIGGMAYIPTRKDLSDQHQRSKEKALLAES